MHQKKIQSDKAVSNWNWSKFGSIIYGDSGDSVSDRVIGIDMDDTIISVKSGAKFAKNADDWQFWHDSVPKILKDKSEQGYRIVIFTNQNGITKGHTNENDIKKKIENIAKSIGINMTALIASNDDENRKPNLGMWKHFVKIVNENTEPILDKSFYVGDAAGRKNGKKKDFSDSDLKFAMNIAIPFQTPEQFFLSQGLDQDLRKLIEFNPRSLKMNGPLFEKDTAVTFTKPTSCEMIIMVGSVGSGKSTFVQNHLKDYTRINRDALKTKEKCLQKAEEAINQKQYVVIDNTNPKQEDRKIFIDLAKKYKYPVRVFYMKVTKDIAFHNDNQRETNKHRQHFSKRVGSIPIHSFFKNSEMPQLSEGIDEIKIVNFIPGPFINQEDQESYFCFTK